MSPQSYYFAPAPEIEPLRSALAGHFGDERVFIYFDAADLFGDTERDENPALLAAYRESTVRVLLRSYDPATGPISGWMTVETGDHRDIDNQALALAMAAAAGVHIFYRDPVPDRDDSPFLEAAQIEVQPSGVQRKVWVHEFGGEDHRTMTAVTDR